MLKQAIFAVIFLLSINIFVLVQERNAELDTTTLITHPKYWSKQVSSYGDYIEDALTYAKQELTIYRNRRPSTRCSLDDIVFTATRHLPNWIYPASIWKQDPTTRHQKIIQIIKAPSIYPYAHDILAKAIDWTSQTSELLENYIKETRHALQQVYDITDDYIDLITQHADLQPTLLATSSDMVQSVISDFLTSNQHNFSRILNQANRDYNRIINVSGALRRPMESIRFDIMQSIQTSKQNELQEIDMALGELARYAHGELKSTSMDLRDYIIQPLRHSLGSFPKTETLLDHLRQKLTWILTMSSNEFKHNPSQFSFWVDLLEEMKRLDIRIMKELPKKFPNKKKPAACCNQ